MNKIRNKWSLDIKGSPTLIEAISKEFKKLGYTIEAQQPIESCGSITSYIDTGEFTIRKTKLEFGDAESQFYKQLNLPENWNEALSLAAETIEEPLKPEIDKWYTFKDKPENVFYVTSVESLTCYGYGFSNGAWFSYLSQDSGYCACNSRSWKKVRLATDKEVAQALIQEAGKRGFVKGVTITRTGINSKFTFPPKPINGELTYFPGRNILDAREGHVFDNGKWAEIQNSKLQIHGYDVEVEPGIIKVGCKKFEYSDLYNLYHLLNSFNFKINLNVDGCKVTKGMLKEIIDFYNRIVGG